MTTLTIEIPDEQMDSLRQRAQAIGLTPEDWIKASIVEQLALPLEGDRKRKIAALTQRLIEERAEVYKALAEGAP